MADQADDKLLKCVDCGVEFSFSARDQIFYQERGYQAPRRCKACRDKRKGSQNPAGGGSDRGGAHGGSFSGETSRPNPAGRSSAGPAPGGGVPAPEFKVNCSTCGVETTVPFKPDTTRPVYCRTCYLNRRKTGS